jgi:hypothetical protein
MNEVRVFMVLKLYGKLAQHGLSNDTKGYQNGTHPCLLKNKGYLCTPYL